MTGDIAVTVRGGSVTNIGAALANGDVFNLFDWGTASGTFDSVSLPALTGGLTWDQSQLYTNDTITVVPEPGAALLGISACSPCFTSGGDFECWILDFGF